MLKFPWVVSKSLVDDDYLHPYTLDRLLRRRRALSVLGATAGALFLGGCGNAISSQAIDPESVGGTTNTGTDGATKACALIPTETIGPYPADGSNNGTDALHQSSLYRANITGGKAGVPLTVLLNLQSLSDGCAPVANAAVYIWHTDKDGIYSGYGRELGQTFCRGVQVSDANGQVNFTTVFPGWYAGRYTHIHFEVFLRNDLSSRATKISQFTFPHEVITNVYSSSLYSGHGQNSSVPSPSRDGIFSDGVLLQTATVAGSISSGLIASLNVGI